MRIEHEGKMSRVYNTLAEKHERNTKFEIYERNANNKTYFRKRQRQILVWMQLALRKV